MRNLAPFSALFGLFLLPGVPSSAGPDVDAKMAAKWTDTLLSDAGLQANNGEQESGGEAASRFAALDPDLQFAVLQKVLPKFPEEGSAEYLFNCIAAYADASATEEPGQVKRLADNINWRLLDILNLGIMDKRAPVQQSALNLLNREFGLKLTLKDYPDWYAKNGKRPVGDVMRDSMTDIVGQLKTEKEGMRTYLLDRLRDIAFTSASPMLKEPEAKGLVAIRMAALRRQAVINAGLLDCIAAVLHGGAIANLDPNDKTTPGVSPIVRRKALALLSVFKPDKAYLARIAPDLQREFEARSAHVGELQGVSASLLLECPGDWPLKALNHWIEADYLRPDFEQTLAPLLETRDFRVLPVLFALMREPESNAASTIITGLTEWNELDGPKEETAEAWLAWWKARPKTVSAAVFDLPPPHFLPQSEVLLRRLTDNAQPDNRALQIFDSFDADLKVNFLRDHWKEIRSDSARLNLLNSAMRGVSATDRDNPETIGLNGRLLELFDIGVSDPVPNNQTIALNYVALLTGNRFKSAAEYAAWRPAQTGKSNAALFREGCAALAKWLAEAKPRELPAALNVALVLSRARGRFDSGDARADAERAAKIMQIRRAALNDSGVTAQIVGLLIAASNLLLQTRSIEYLQSVKPDAAALNLAEPTVRKLVEVELAKKNNLNPELLAGVLLYDAPWTTDVLLERLQKRYDENAAFVILPLAKQKGDPRFIPTLIALLDNAEPIDGLYAQAEDVLRALSKPPQSEIGDVHGWVLWWEKHRSDYPAARALPYPRIAGSAARLRTYTLPQEVREVRFRDEPNSGYWRITSGYLVTLSPAAQAAAYVPGAAVAEMTEAQKPGLLIVLTNSAADFTKQKKYWLDFNRFALKGRYVIALIAPPDSKNAKTLWPLHTAGTSDAGQTAQALTAATIQDLLSTVPVSKTRRYCVGIGEGGMAALACVLSPSLGISGIVADTAPFRSTDLPPLTNAKGKRIAVLRDQSSHAVPLFIQKVAQQTLTKAGAILRSASYDGKSASLNAAPYDALEAAVMWLESGK